MSARRTRSQRSSGTSLEHCGRPAGLVVVLGSPQNVDRLVTVYRAALRSGRRLAMDAYGADVARATGRPTIPRPGPEWPRVSAYLPQRQRVRIKSLR